MIILRTNEAVLYEILIGRIALASAVTEFRIETLHLHPTPFLVFSFLRGRPFDLTNVTHLPVLCLLPDRLSTRPPSEQCLYVCGGGKPGGKSHPKHPCFKSNVNVLMGFPLFFFNFLCLSYLVTTAAVPSPSKRASQQIRNARADWVSKFHLGSGNSLSGFSLNAPF